MSRNGDRHPPRPRIEMLSPADPSEAAAVIAAVEQFLADTAPAPRPAERVNPWQRAALLEGVERLTQTLTATEARFKRRAIRALPLTVVKDVRHLSPVTSIR